MCRLIKSYTGKYLAQELHDCLKHYGVSKKILRAWSAGNSVVESGAFLKNRPPNLKHWILRDSINFCDELWLCVTMCDGFRAASSFRELGNLPDSLLHCSLPAPAFLIAGGKTRAEWLPKTSLCFVKALAREKTQGHMVENGFKPVAWTRAAAAIQSELGLSFDSRQLKNQWNSVWVLLVSHSCCLWLCLVAL